MLAGRAVPFDPRLGSFRTGSRRAELGMRAVIRAVAAVLLVSAVTAPFAVDPRHRPRAGSATRGRPCGVYIRGELRSKRGEFGGSRRFPFEETSRPRGSMHLIGGKDLTPVSLMRRRRAVAQRAGLPDDRCAVVPQLQIVIRDVRCTVRRKCGPDVGQPTHQ